MKVITKNKGRNKIKDLILVSFGILEYENGDYFGKSAVINYAHEISEYFNKTYFICSIHNGKNYFNTKLDTNKVEPIGIGLNRQDNILSQLRCLVKDQIRLVRLVTKKTAVIFNSPMIWFTPVLPLLSLKSEHLSGYMANSPESVARLQSSEGGIGSIIKSKITILFGKLIVPLSDSLLIRGDISQYKEYSNKIYKSKPIIVLSENEEQSHVGRDICNRKNITILYVGGLYKRKGIDVLMNAVSNLIKKDILNEKSLNLKIIGDGEEHKNLLLEAHKLNIDTKTEFLGWIDDPDRLTMEYTTSDIFVLPSKEAEGFPRVIDEAMYYGIPVVTTDLGYGNSLEHKKNIFFIKPCSVIELEKAIEEVINNEVLRRKMIENGKKRIENIRGGESAAEQHARIVKGNLSGEEDGKDDREVLDR